MAWTRATADDRSRQDLRRKHRGLRAPQPGALRLPLRAISIGSFFNPEFVAPRCLEPGTVAWLLARHRSTWLPDWLFVGWSGRTGRGRDAWPPVVLAALIVLRWSEQGMSRRGAVARAATDITWRAAMGLELGGDTPSEKTLRKFEKFLQQRHGDTQLPRYLLLHEHVVRACLSAGIARERRPTWVTDSTPMGCYGAVRDTVRLIGDGLRSLASLWARATRATLEAVAQEWKTPLLLEKSTKGAFRVDWHDDAARARVVSKLAETVTTVVADIRRTLGSDAVRASLQKSVLRRCRHLLRVVSQDLETDGNGKLVVARKVAADRLISLSDPEARHGRKRRARRSMASKSICSATSPAGFCCHSPSRAGTCTTGSRPTDSFAGPTNSTRVSTGYSGIPRTEARTCDTPSNGRSASACFRLRLLWSTRRVAWVRLASPSTSTPPSHLPPRRHERRPATVLVQRTRGACAALRLAQGRLRRVPAQ
ncbi:conserved hypothetical protein [Stigmatella aurantiaca DW4/3-1]|uniref:Transposase InsH N-terminal domain-containing protein n=1 Tax=Stigmatella aurantiaca (strain DW4/3-1) TaxID=378806 RepID=Q08QB5_STIAD|nr:conserved hypothetical protein [Stigmatella aurantiaca DW4/3-1]